jgi:formylglycine-generating enzyme required for sulfatase activity
MTTIRIWSGRETRALREARRMSQRDFAAHLGINERMVSKWESGGEKINPRPVNQSALDASLASAPADVQERFTKILNLARRAPDEESGENDDYTSGSPLAIMKHQVRHPIDGKLMTLVEGGDFLYGGDNESRYIPGFYIDVFPVTNSDYARFSSATGHRPPQHWSRAGEPPGNLLEHPAAFVTWNDAHAYASWAAKSLASNKQWEKAARGERGNVYPWGSQMTAAKCNVRESGIGSTTPVDRYHSGASPYGVYDMCGNCWEWLGTESDRGRRELRGGAFTSPFARAAPSLFNDASVDMLDDDTSFRCVIPEETMRALVKMNS